ncbi:MAG: transposase [Owenweeksia sp.]|nr:transposase [Owenweeksia sp.]
MTAILHTWGQNLSLHPHLHCIVPGGGITATGKWKPAKNKGKWLFPVKDKGMSQVFRAKYMALLRQWAKSEEVSIDRSVFKKCFDHNWVVFAKDAFRGPKGVMEYLGRYSHKIAISNHRLVSIGDDKVAFKWKDYRTLKNGVMELGSRWSFCAGSACIFCPKVFRVSGTMASWPAGTRPKGSNWPARPSGCPKSQRPKNNPGSSLPKSDWVLMQRSARLAGAKWSLLGEFLPGRPPPHLIPVQINACMKRHCITYGYSWLRPGEFQNCHSGDTGRICPNLKKLTSKIPASLKQTAWQTKRNSIASLMPLFLAKILTTSS